MCDIEKEWHRDVVEVDEDRELLGKFPREQNQRQFNDHLVPSKHFENRKSFSGVGKYYQHWGRIFGM